nr:Isocitrate dehydrogenase 3 (NAD+) gamma [Danio rerio]
MATLTKALKPILGRQLGNTAKVFGAGVVSQRGKPTYSGRIIPPPAKYGGRHTVTLIPGDGIGPELLNHVRELFRFSCVPVDFEVVHVNSSSTSEDDISNAIMAIRRNGVALKGNIETNHTMPPNHKSRNNLLRTSLDLYANVMHCQSLPGVQTRHKNIDIIIILEKSEFSALLAENEKIKVELLQLRIQLADVINKRRADIILDLNIEKSRVKEMWADFNRKLIGTRNELLEMNSEQDRHVTQTNMKIDTEVAGLKTMLEAHKLDTIKYLAGSVFTCLTVILGFYRIWM